MRLLKLKKRSLLGLGKRSLLGLGMGILLTGMSLPLPIYASSAVEMVALPASAVTSATVVPAVSAAVSAAPAEKVSAAVQPPLSLRKSLAVKHHGYTWRLEELKVNEMPRNFRTSHSPLAVQSEPTNLTGLRKLRLSGSAQPAAAEIPGLLVRLRQENNGGPVYDVDLRLESHGYFNGRPVSWYGKKNWVNVGLSREQVLRDEKTRLAKAKGQTVPLTYFIKGVGQAQPPLLVQKVSEESKEIRAHGGRYYRLTVADHLAPLPAQVDDFLKFYRSLPADAWLHFHCQAGMGRTTTFMTMTDIIHNAGRVSVEDIVSRQQRLNNGTDLFHPGGKIGGVTNKGEQQRAEFIRSFFDFVRHYPKLDHRWSDWCQENNL